MWSQVCSLSFCRYIEPQNALLTSFVWAWQPPKQRSRGGHKSAPPCTFRGFLFKFRLKWLFMDDFAINITWIDYLNYNWHVTAQNDNIKGMKKVARSPDGVNDVVLFYPSPNSPLLSFYKIYLLNCRQIWYWMLYWIITSISQHKMPHKEHKRLSACCVSPPPPPTAYYFLMFKIVWQF